MQYTLVGEKRLRMEQRDDATEKKEVDWQLGRRKRPAA